MIGIIKKFLALNQYSQFVPEFESLVLSHPNYPSIFAITDTLDMLSIENAAVKVPKEQLNDLPETFLAVYDNQIVLVLKKETLGVETEKEGNIALTSEEFQQKWDGIIVAIEPGAVIVPKKTRLEFSLLRYVLPFVLLLLVSFWYASYNLTAVLFLITVTLGVIASVFILQEKLGLANEMVSKFCTSNATTSCDSVINSNKSIITKWIDFSDLPILFFGSSLLAILIQPVHSVLAIGSVSLLSLPIVAYSIVLQKTQLQKWCLMCLFVSGIVVIQSVLFVGLNRVFASEVFLSGVVLYLSALVLVTTIWFAIKPIIIEKIEAQKGLNELKKFKRNYGLFDFLSKDISSTDGLSKLKGIALGNDLAGVRLTLIVSPGCGHCDKAIEEGLELITKYPEKIGLTILFNVNPENEDNPYTAIVRELLAINDAENSRVTEALTDWHIKKMTMEQWIKKWGSHIVTMQVTQQIYLQYQWCMKNDFNYTPVKIINNRLFPNEYEISELKYFLNDFSEVANFSEVGIVTEVETV